MPKSAKSKEKKEKRKALAEKEKALRAATGAATQVTDQLATLQPFRKFKKNGLDLDLEFVWAENMTEAQKQFVFTLLEKNMREIYEGADGWGWKPAEKREQIFDMDARYVIAVEAESRKPVAFMQLQFLIEEDVGGYTSDLPVLYVWEIQLTEQVQRKGLGKWLMKLSEMMAIRNKLPFVLLTVLKNNPNALEFYNKIGFNVTDHSPALDEPEEQHVILGKCFDPDFKYDSGEPV